MLDRSSAIYKVNSPTCTKLLMMVVVCLLLKITLSSNLCSRKIPFQTKLSNRMSKSRSLRKIKLSLMPAFKRPKMKLKRSGNKLKATSSKLVNSRKRTPPSRERPSKLLPSKRSLLLSLKLSKFILLAFKKRTENTKKILRSSASKTRILTTKRSTLKLKSETLLVRTITLRANV